MKIQRNILMLDAGFASYPLLRAAQQQGYRVSICSAKAEDPGMLFADEAIHLDYRKYQEVLHIARERNISGLLPGVTDVSYLTGAMVADELGLPGYDHPDVCSTLFMKNTFRTWATRHGYPVPMAAKNEEEAAAFTFPLIVKPVDAYSGLGITRVQNCSELSDAISIARNASACGEIVIETFCEGTLHSHSAFIRNGKIVCEFFVDEYCTVYPWQVNSSSLSLCLSESLRQRVSQCMQTLVSELGLVDGLLHTQFIANDETFWLIELTRRCPGDLYSRLIELSTDQPYSAWFTHPFLGESSQFPFVRPQHWRAVARHTISVQEKQRFSSLSLGALEAKFIEAIPLKQPGDWVHPAPADRAGIIFAEFPEFTDLATMTPQLYKFWSLRNH